MSPSKTSTVDFATFHNVVNGQLRGAKNTYTGINPSTKEELWPVPVATTQDVEDAVKAANDAFPAWSQTPIEKRKDTLREYMELYQGYEAELIELMTKECGKPVCCSCLLFGCYPELTIFLLRDNLPLSKSRELLAFSSTTVR
jgi:delta 1-pyrroline-5-carboxylate dehydrogenase